MPAANGLCPHCGKPSATNQRRRWGVALLGIAGVTSLGLTMMACYGAPPCGPDHNCANPDASGDAGNKPDAGTTP